MNSFLPYPSFSRLVSRLTKKPGGCKPQATSVGLRLKPSIILGLIVGLEVLVAPVRGGDDVVAVYSSVAPGYSRPVQSDGKFKPETYAFGEGGNRGGVMKDPTIDQLKFTDIAHVVAPALASQNYVPCSTSDPRKADLLIMMYWGTTDGTDDTSSSSEYQIAQSLVPPPAVKLPPLPGGGAPAPMEHDGRESVVAEAFAIRMANESALQQAMTLSQMANRQRDRQNWENAAVLGYLDDMKRTEGLEMTALASRRKDVIDEVEESRYYVVLMAYDFQALWQHKQKKLLWETRFSIRQRRNDFGMELAAMAESASRLFGQNSDGLRHAKMHDEHIAMGDLKIIRVEPDRK